LRADTDDTSRMRIPPHSIGAVSNEVVEEAQDVALIGAVGGCREAEEEGGIEAVEEAAIRGASAWWTSSTTT
jgi:hypothetical protein